MSAKLSGLSRLLASAGLGAIADAAPAPAVTLADAVTPVLDENGAPLVLESDATEAVRAAHAAGRAEGVKAERTRTSEVLASDPAKANYPAAAFLLGKTDATSADIIKDLPELGTGAPAPAASAPAPAAEPSAPALTVDLEQTPKVIVGAGEPAAHEGDDHQSMWDDVIKGHSAASPFTPPVLVNGGVPQPRAGH